MTGWTRGAPSGSPGEESQTPATGWVVRPQDPDSDEERTRSAPGDTPPTGPPAEDSQTPATGWVTRAADPAPDAGSVTPATGSMWAGGGVSGASPQFHDAQPGSEEPTLATGWVIAGAVPPAADDSDATETGAHGDPAGRASPPGWPQAPAISWAQAPMAPGNQGPAAWAAPPRRRRRSWWLGSVAAAVLAVLMVAGGGLGFAAATRVAPTSTPRPQPTLRPTLGPIGSVDSPLITLGLPAGWLEQQQSGTDVKLVHFPNGSMDIRVQSTTAVGASTPQAVLQKTQQRISSSPNTVGLVTTCVQPAAHTIAGRAGLEEGFQFQERGIDGKTLFTNCDVVWASVENGEVYVWGAFDTLDQLQASTAAATRMQRTAQWKE